MPAGHRLVCPHGRLHLATCKFSGPLDVGVPPEVTRPLISLLSSPIPSPVSLSSRSSDSLPSPHPPPPPHWWSHPGRGGCCRASRRGGPPRRDGIPRAPRQATPRWGRYGLRDGHAVAEADLVQQVRPRAEVHDGVHPGLVLIHGTHLSFPQGSVSLSSPIP